MERVSGKIKEGRREGGGKGGFRCGSCGKDVFMR